MDEPVDMARGVPQSYFVDEFASDGIMLEGIAGPPDYVAMGLPCAGERHRELMAGYRDVAQFGLMISDDSRGRVHSLARAAARPLRPLRRRRRPRAGAGSSSSPSCSGPPARSRVLLPAGPQAGAADPAEPIPDLRPPRPQADGLPSARHRAHGRARPAHGVLDADGRVHGTDGVYVCDGSAVPSALGVNPQITIMTLATRLAHHLCRS